MKIAITGGIGSGKSTLTKAFKKMGYPCFSCDEIYKEIFEEDEYKNALVSALGADILTDGKLDRKKISAAVFSDKEKLALLNGAAHPLVIKRLKEKTDKYPLSFAEVPLLFEGGYENDFDKVIIVYRAKEERILSVMERDGCARGEVERRMACQVDYDKLINCGYAVIYNDGDENALRQKAEWFIESL